MVPSTVKLLHRTPVLIRIQGSFACVRNWCNKGAQHSAGSNGMHTQHDHNSLDVFAHKRPVPSGLHLHDARHWLMRIGERISDGKGTG